MAFKPNARRLRRLSSINLLASKRVVLCGVQLRRVDKYLRLRFRIFGTHTKIEHLVRYCSENLTNGWVMFLSDNLIRLRHIRPAIRHSISCDQASTQRLFSISSRDLNGCNSILISFSFFFSLFYPNAYGHVVNRDVFNFPKGFNQSVTNGNRICNHFPGSSRKIKLIACSLA